ncbi:hypothetical protein GWK48_10380 [Metallosphaera tengchongensis]|uniref:CRISPR type III-associated protein domain-containing protein n=1 Tax=Metallosphaera tengchongensis TaxID=1532350 RepID=A0A6N0NYW2_9CREN|nr:RAMP superfamily CRISPR-associated protein [Metallosphaera tengchongensis]QKR00739.1 hypothetical protein GWK48_10380 [Metallosphaera tengchongensis]
MEQIPFKQIHRVKLTIKTSLNYEEISTSKAIIEPLILVSRDNYVTELYEYFQSATLRDEFSKHYRIVLREIGSDGKLIISIPGSSIKGLFRFALDKMHYLPNRTKMENITKNDKNSSLPCIEYFKKICKDNGECRKISCFKSNEILDRLPARSQDLCLACRLFGTTGLKSVLSFKDAHSDSSGVHCREREIKYIPGNITFRGDIIISYTPVQAMLIRNLLKEMEINDDVYTFVKNLLDCLSSYISKYMALGQKKNKGYGKIEVEISEQRNNV